MEELIGYISNLGFPMALSIYLLVRVESKLEMLTKSINELSMVIGGREGR